MKCDRYSHPFTDSKIRLQFRGCQCFSFILKSKLTKYIKLFFEEIPGKTCGIRKRIVLRIRVNKCGNKSFGIG
jgi:hypothetical protein